MADKLFSTLVYRVNPYTPGCPQQTIIKYVREAAIRVCERTLAWRAELPKFNLQPGVHEYAYNNPAGTDVHAIFEAVVNGDKLERLTLEQAICRYPKWSDLFSGQDPDVVWNLTPTSGFNDEEFNEDEFNAQDDLILDETALEGASTPRVICQLRPDRFIVLPPPDADIAYTTRMFVALKPKRNATGMEATLMDELEDVIVHGALQQLLVLPKQNWTDKELATYHARQYTYMISERRARANLGNMRGSMRVRSQPFGA